MLRVCVIGLGHIGNLHARIYQEDELVEITPNHMRMRKIQLDPLDRKRNSSTED